jgi:hypothetical protein
MTTDIGIGKDTGIVVERYAGRKPKTAKHLISELCDCETPAGYGGYSFHCADARMYRIVSMTQGMELTRREMIELNRVLTAWCLQHGRYSL